MVTNAEIAGLEEPELHYSLCVANLDGAQQLCKDMIAGNYASSFSHATVIMSLHHHGVELFLKYALSKADSEYKKDHHIRGLLDAYKAIYSTENFNLELPYLTEYLGHSPEEVRERLRSEEPNQIDNMLRYHTDRRGQAWAGVYVFDPESFYGEVSNLAAQLAHVRQEIERRYNQPS